jgi:hypothetical protein
MVAIAGARIEAAQLIPGRLDGVGRGRYAGPQRRRGHALNLGVLAGASSSASSSSSSSVTVTDAPAISSEVMNSPT